MNNKISVSQIIAEVLCPDLSKSDSIDEDIYHIIQCNYNKLSIETRTRISDNIKNYLTETQDTFTPELYQFRYYQNNQHCVDYGQYSEWKTCSYDEYIAINKYISDGKTYESRILYSKVSTE